MNPYNVENPTLKLISEKASEATERLINSQSKSDADDVICLTNLEMKLLQKAIIKHKNKEK
jgi:hypothetical protein